MAAKLPLKQKNKIKFEKSKNLFSFVNITAYLFIQFFFALNWLAEEFRILFPHFLFVIVFKVFLFLSAIFA